jgi:hypothetical protein
MDIVIPLGRGSTWGDNEIRYSLRSIEKHLKGYDNIFVVGELPTFLKNVIHISCPNVQLKPQRSIFNKIMCAVNDERVSENFIHFSDYYYLLKNVYVNDLAYYHNGELSERILKYGGRYRQAMQNSLDAGAVYNYDIHTPFVYSKEQFKNNVASQNWEREYIIKSLYMKDRDGEYLDDCKVNRSVMFKDLVKMTEGMRFLSSGLLCPAMREFLIRSYPNKSRYE